MFAGPVAADGTDDYPIPHRIIITTCDAEQYLAAVRDTSPVYYSRYMIDMHNRPADIQQMAQDRIHWFFALGPVSRRQYSERYRVTICRRSNSPENAHADRRAQIVPE